MNKLFYPAVFHIAEEGGFWVSFPDFPEAFTQGESMEEAYTMTADALGLCISDLLQANKKLPVPSLPTEVEVEGEAVLVVIKFDMEAYKRKHNAKAIKKTLTIPEWLNEEATEAGVNFSQVLQEALLQKLALKNNT